MTFEESMRKLEEMSEKIKDENISLEEAMKCYEEGINYYNVCDTILREAQQKIDAFNMQRQEEA